MEEASALNSSRYIPFFFFVIFADSSEEAMAWWTSAPSSVDEEGWGAWPWTFLSVSNATCFYVQTGYMDEGLESMQSYLFSVLKLDQPQISPKFPAWWLTLYPVCCDLYLKNYILPSECVLSTSVEEIQCEGGIATISTENAPNRPYKYCETECLPIPETWQLSSWTLSDTIIARRNILLSESGKQIKQ